MAKIGNETKLILKLATEQMTRAEQTYRTRHSHNHPEMVSGYVDCREEYQATLDLIVIELEGK